MSSVLLVYISSDDVPFWPHVHLYVVAESCFACSGCFFPPTMWCNSAILKWMLKEWTALCHTILSVLLIPLNTTRRIHFFWYKVSSATGLILQCRLSECTEVSSGGFSYPARRSLFFHHLCWLLLWQPNGCVFLSLPRSLFPSFSLSAHWDLCSCLWAAEEGLTEDAQRKTRSTCAPLGF